MQHAEMISKKSKHPANLSLTGGLLLLLACTHVAAVDLSDLSSKERIVRLEQLWENQNQVDLILRLDEMQQEIQRLRGELELQSHTIETLQNEQREVSQLIERGSPVNSPANGSQILSLPPESPAIDLSGVDPEASISAILDGENGLLDDAGTVDDALPAPDPVDDVAQTTDLDGIPPDTGAALVGDSEKTVYDAAFSRLKKGEYDKASAAFSAYLVSFPAGQNAANAQYWLGESQYVKRNFNDARQSYESLLAAYPASARRADAALKLGLIHYEEGRWSEARKALNAVKTSYPASSAAKLADARLQKMNKESR